MPSRDELWVEKRNAATRMNEIQDLASREGRARTEEESARYNEAADRVAEIERIMEQEDQHAARMRDLTEARRDPRIGRDPEGGEETGYRSEAYARAFERHVRRERLTEEERGLLDREMRVLSGMVGSSGGYLVPATFLARIQETQLWYGGALQAGPEIFNSDSGEEIMWPTNDDTSNEGELLAEGATVSQQDVTFGQKKISAYVFSSKMIKVPWQLRQDASFDISSFLSRKFGERLGRTKNRYLTLGTGANQPQGMVPGATVGETAASATAVTYNELLDLEHSVDPAYRDYTRCKYMWNDGTFKAVRQLADSQGRPLWEPSLKEGQASVFNGYRYVINSSMANMAASAKTILFGDFFAYYIVRQVGGIVLIELNELYKAQLQDGFFAVERWDGGVKDTSAVKALQQAA